MADKSKKTRIQKLQNKAEDKIILELFKIRLEDGDFEKLPNKIDPEVKVLLKEYHEYIGTDGKFSSTKYPHCFVTFNPDNKYDDKPDEFIQLMANVVSKKWIKNAIYVFEQRSKESEIWHGLHCHMLIERRHKRECEFKREIKNTVKNMGDIKNSHILNFSFRPTKEVDKTINYMLGEKDEDKMLKIPQDEYMREELELESYYTKGCLYDPELESPSDEEEEELTVQEKISEAYTIERVNNQTVRPRIPMPKIPVGTKGRTKEILDTLSIPTEDIEEEDVEHFEC